LGRRQEEQDEENTTNNSTTVVDESITICQTPLSSSQLIPVDSGTHQNPQEEKEDLAITMTSESNCADEDEQILQEAVRRKEARKAEIAQ
jgi:hypothetical protein